MATVPNPHHVKHGSSVDEIHRSLKEKQNFVEEILTSAGWTQLKSPYEGVDFSSKHYPNCPISVFKGSGLIDATPKEICDYFWNMTTEDMQKQDPNMIERIVVDQPSPNIRVVKQTSKLPWPLWNRQAVYAVHRDVRSDGSEWILLWTVDSPKAKVDETQFVPAYMHIGVWGFEPKEGKCLMHRIGQLDPSGNIPTWVIEVNSGLMVKVIDDWRHHFASLKQK